MKGTYGLRKPPKKIAREEGGIKRTENQESDFTVYPCSLPAVSKRKPHSTVGEGTWESLLFQGMAPDLGLTLEAGHVRAAGVQSERRGQINHVHWARGATKEMAEVLPKTKIYLEFTWVTLPGFTIPI